MEDSISSRNISLEITVDELSSIVHALFNEITDRLIWAMKEGHWAREAKIEVVQFVVERMITAYLKAFNAFKELPQETVDAQYVKTFTIDEDTWRILDKLTSVSSWDEFPTDEA